MKKIISILFLGILFFSFYSYAEVAKGKDEKLIYIINSLGKMNASLREWSIYYQDEDKMLPSIDSFKAIELKLKNDYPDFQWVTESDKNHHIKITGESNKNENGRQMVSLTAYKLGDKYKVLQSYSYTGKKWSDKQYFKIIQKLKNKERIFFTVKAKLNVPEYTNTRKEANKFLTQLSATQVESLQEKDFVSISAYKESWGGSLFTKNQKKINLQLGVRRNTDDRSINVTIGSPIITVEY